jgi:hypothetical protein
VIKVLRGKLYVSSFWFLVSRYYRGDPSKSVFCFSQRRNETRRRKAVLQLFPPNPNNPPKSWFRHHGPNK